MSDTLKVNMQFIGLPWWLSGKEFTYQCRRHRFDPWLRKIAWRSKWQPTPVFLGFPGDSAGNEPAGNVGDLVLIPGLGRSLGEGKRLPAPVFWPEEFHGLQFMGSQRVRHN